MKYLAIALLLPLAGCATTGTHVGQTLCGHRVALEAAAQAGLVQAYAIVDPVKREAVISGFNLSLAALSKCPPPPT